MLEVSESSRATGSGATMTDWREKDAAAFEEKALVADQALVALEEVAEAYADDEQLQQALRVLTALLRDRRNERLSTAARLRAVTTA